LSNKKVRKNETEILNILQIFHRIKSNKSRSPRKRKGTALIEKQNIIVFKKS